MIMRYTCRHRHAIRASLIRPCSPAAIHLEQMNVSDLLSALYTVPAGSGWVNELQDKLTFRSMALLPLMSPLQLNQMLYGFVNVFGDCPPPLLAEVSNYLLYEKDVSRHFDDFWELCTANDLVLLTKILIRCNFWNAPLLSKLLKEAESNMQHFLPSDLQILIRSYVKLIQLLPSFPVLNTLINTQQLKRICSKSATLVQRCSPVEFEQLFFNATLLLRLLKASQSIDLFCEAIKFIRLRHICLNGNQLLNCIVSLLECFEEIERSFKSCTDKDLELPAKVFLKVSSSSIDTADMRQKFFFLKFKSNELRSMFHLLLKDLSRKCEGVDPAKCIYLLGKVNMLAYYPFDVVEGLFYHIIRRLHSLDTDDIGKMLQLTISRRLRFNIVSTNDLKLLCLYSQDLTTALNTHGLTNDKKLSAPLQLPMQLYFEDQILENFQTDITEAINKRIPEFSDHALFELDRTLQLTEDYTVNWCQSARNFQRTEAN